jgi:meso-butanediol dehydrogenase/(S,S)-butanediol dehydrogenase/diacetyl reductase
VTVSRRFVDKVALVTGAAAGIGRATTLLLAREGASVLAVDLDAERLKETAALAGGHVEAYVADLSDPEACRVAVEHCVATYSRLDVLGNIAGIAGAQHFTDVTVEQYRRMMGINLDACFFLSQAAIGHLVDSEGSIISIASTAGVTGQAYTSVYSASKAAVIHLTKSLAMEYIKTGVRINAIAPGGINTPLVQNFEFPPDLDAELAMRYAPLRGLGDPEDIASMFAYLASEEARAIHGAVVSVDNGMTAG